MKFKPVLLCLPFLMLTASALAENANRKPVVFNFSTRVERTVERDVMEADLFSRKSGKSLPELKKVVAKNLNQVLNEVKKHPTIEVQTDGISNTVDYGENHKINRWIAAGYIHLKSKDFDAMAKVLENLPNEIAVSQIWFSVSAEKKASFEDEMTLEIIKQFQAKAEVIKQGLGVNRYHLTKVQLDTPNGHEHEYFNRAMPMSANAIREEMPLEAGKATLSATASGNVEFE